MTRRTAPGRSAARLAAVQGLYEIEMTGAAPERVMLEIIGKRWSGPDRTNEEQGSKEPKMIEPDRALLTTVVRGVTQRRRELDEIANAALADNWRMDRLEILLRGILRAGVYELLAEPETPAKVVIDEYVNVAHAFFSGGEPPMVNGVLDRIAHTLRPDEVGAGTGKRDLNER